MYPGWLIPAFGATSLAYALAGLGGGSTYLALMAVAGVEHESMRVTALALNLAVAGGGLLHHARAGNFDARLLVPFAVTSIPAAFVAGLVRLPAALFTGLLGGALALAAIRMLCWREPLLRPRDVSWAIAWRWGPPVGALLGLLAGLVGIGGGIFLGPVLILGGWASGKRAAAVSAAFITVNSLAGLAAHLSRANAPDVEAWPLFVAVLAGGQAGAVLGAFRLAPASVQRVFGVLVGAVAVRLLLGSPG